MFGSFLSYLVLGGVILAAALSLWTLLVYLRGPRVIRRHAGLGVLLLIAALVVGSLTRDAYAAAGTGTLTVGDLKFDYFTDGTTLISIRKKNQVFVYAVLTSAQTTDLREVYTTIPQAAAGGQSPTAVDGTATLPSCAPHLGDLTD